MGQPDCTTRFVYEHYLLTVEAWFSSDVVVARVAEVPGAITQADTLEEAVDDLVEAVDVLLYYCCVNQLYP